MKATPETAAISPRPWGVLLSGRQNKTQTIISLYGNQDGVNGDAIAKVKRQNDRDFIVRACNSYDASLAAMKAALLFVERLESDQGGPTNETSKMMPQLRAAISQATQ